jgi:uncharacterized protein (DUF433 family)
MDASDLITVDPEILGGTAVFKDTRVPVQTLFEYLEDDYTLEEFLECFPTVTREMAKRVLSNNLRRILSSAPLNQAAVATMKPGEFKSLQIP